MTCSTKIENRVHFNNPDEFKRTLKKFVGNLFDVKNFQIMHEKSKSTNFKK